MMLNILCLLPTYDPQPVEESWSSPWSSAAGEVFPSDWEPGTFPPDWGWSFLGSGGPGILLVTAGIFTWGRGQEGLYWCYTGWCSCLSRTLEVCMDRKLIMSVYCCKINGIYPDLLSVGRYPVLNCQSPMNAICWPGSRVFSGKVFMHPAEPAVLSILRRFERISREY